MELDISQDNPDYVNKNHSSSEILLIPTTSGHPELSITSKRNSNSTDTTDNALCWGPVCVSKANISIYSNEFYIHRIIISTLSFIFILQKTAIIVLWNISLLYFSKFILKFYTLQFFCSTAFRMQYVPICFVIT